MKSTREEIDQRPSPHISYETDTHALPAMQPETTTALDLEWVRAQFPSLCRTVNGRPATFLDGPGGTQVPQRVIDAISDYLKRDNSNTGGAYATSRHTDAMIAGARSAMADFLGCDPDEVVFGSNMTALTFAISRSIGRELGAGDEIVLTHLDHDANISPWRALEERGVTIRMAEIHEDDCTLNMDDLARKITNRTKLVAVGYASNAVGTINDVAEIVRLATCMGRWLILTRSIMRRTERSTFGRSTVIFWCARLTSFLARTWVCSMASVNTCCGLSLTRFAPTRTRFPTAGNGAR